MPNNKNVDNGVLTTHVAEQQQHRKTDLSFAEDVRKGLTSFPKHLSSKYFYDEKGNEWFQKIMHSEEYYLTDCENEIFKTQSNKIIDALLTCLSGFDVVELGPGDCYKSIHLLKAIQNRQLSSVFFPVDISSDVIQQLERTLPSRLPGLQIKGMTGDYIDTLKKVSQVSSNNKLILFLGSSIGNMALGEDVRFFNAVRRQMKKNDLLLTGFDLQKNPKTILAAYNDHKGFTRAFNLNLLHRINRELNGNFKPDQFDHYPTYDPETGTCKSYLISLQKQEVYIKDLSLKVHFAKNEPVLMERSQKYTLSQIDSFSKQAGFEPVHYFMDAKEWFTDALWRAI